MSNTQNNTVEKKLSSGVVAVFRKPTRGEIKKFSGVEKDLEGLSNEEAMNKSDELLLQFLEKLTIKGEEKPLSSDALDDLLMEDFNDLNEIFSEVVSGKKK